MDEDDGPLTLAEEEVTYYPLPVVRDSTLGEQALNEYCPLAQHCRRSKSRYGLGKLHVLPVEILNMVLGQLDLHSIMSLQRVNRRAFDMVTTMPQLKTIIRHSPDVIRAIFSTETAPFITCQLLFNKLTSTACETCSDFAGYLYLLTCTRVCYRCFTHQPRYLPILRSDARRQFGLSVNGIKLLPKMNSVPGRYTILNKTCQSRLILIDSDTARQAGLAIHASTSGIERHIARLAAQKMSAYHKRAGSAGGKRVPYRRPPREHPPRDDHEYNSRRFMAIVPVPFIDIRSGRAEWGFHCLGCRNEFGEFRHSRRQFIATDFRYHLRQFGGIVNEKHMGPVFQEIDRRYEMKSSELRTTSTRRR